MLSKKQIELVKITKEYSNKELKKGCLYIYDETGEVFTLRDYNAVTSILSKRVKTQYLTNTFGFRTNKINCTILGNALSLPTLLICFAKNGISYSFLHSEGYMQFSNIEKKYIGEIEIKDPINMSDEEIQNVLDLFIKIGIGQKQEKK